LRPKGIIDSVQEIEGVALESLFLQELRALNDYFGLGYELFYWRTQTGMEVDFIAYGERGFQAYEIKRASRVTEKDCKGLRAFKAEYPEAQLYLIYGGNTRYYYEDVQVIPYVEALRGLLEIMQQHNG
jgi:uncharacterized protein